MIIHEFTVMP